MEDEKNQIDEMLEGYDVPPIEGEPPIETLPETPPIEEPIEPPVETLPVEKPPVEEPVVAELPIEEPLGDELEPETMEEELARLRSQVPTLLQRVEDLSAGESPAPRPKSEPTPTPKPEPTPTPASVEPIDFVKGRDLVDLLDTPEGLNKFLNEVISKIQSPQLSVEPIVERILTSLPNIVTQQVTRQGAINELVNDFYKVNSDLLPVKRSVGMFANEVHAENPDWEVKKVFEEAGVRTRKALGLRERATSLERKTPAFAKQRGARRGGEKKELVGMAKEIDELLDGGF